MVTEENSGREDAITMALEAAICAEIPGGLCEQALTMLLGYSDVFHLLGQLLGWTDMVVFGVWKYQAYLAGA